VNDGALGATQMAFGPRPKVDETQKR
jgi:hypothetical protein